MPFHCETDADGIVTVTMDMDGSANTMGAEYDRLMGETLARLEAQDGLAGVVLASAKPTFFAGADLNWLLAIERVDDDMFADLLASKALLRRLERLPVPVVAAINGAALGGGYEIGLACNRRLVADDPKAVTGLPEVTLGLLPGAGGVVRLTALLGLEKALPVLLEGKPHAPADALAMGMVDEIVERGGDLVAAAKSWIRANPGAAVQPWDRKGFRYPGGNADAPSVRMTAAVAPTRLVKKTRGLMPAPEKILDVAVNSMRMAFDTALTVETRAFVSLVTRPEAKAAIATNFFAANALRRGAYRPDGERWVPARAAVLGAGMMGAGIAHANAARGIATHLTDRDLPAAQKGLEAAKGIADRAVERARLSPDARDALVGLITPGAGHAFGPVDLVVEAVFEDLALKREVIAGTFGNLTADGIYGTNTSTLPISLLASAVPEPERFIGIHFFSPVEKMRAVELIVGEATSTDTLRKAYDYAAALGKTPIVVNDARGFFTSRVFSTYVDEGMALLADGVPPAVIERAAWLAGMPVGPLAVVDETSLVLSKRVYDTHDALDAELGVTSGWPADATATREVGYAMIELGRGGRHYGGGFYEYPAGKPKRLWEGLSRFAKGNAQVPLEDVKDRLIYRQSLETLRCLAEGVLRSEAEANIGSIYAIGFPPHTGGALQYIRMVGAERFADRAEALAERYGRRFAVAREAYASLAAEPRRAA